MAARISDGAAVTRVDAGGGEATRPIPLADRARGKVTLGETTVLFQLLSPRDELIHWTEGRASRGGLAAAAVKGAARPLPILQWLDPAIDAEKLKKIHWDAALLEGPDVLRVGLQEFQREIKRQLEALSRPPEPKAEKSATPFVYIAADENDLDHALQLQGIVSKLGAVTRIMEEENKLKDFSKGAEFDLLTTKLNQLATQLGSAYANKDNAAANDALTAMKQACKDCHKKFR